MGIYVNPNNVTFQKCLNSPIYVDKSMLIAEINKIVNTEKCFVCVSRARRFGKSMAEDMLCAYFSKGCDSRELFADLKIAKDSSFEKYLNKLNVIKLDVNAVFSNRTPQEIESGINFQNRDIVPIFTKAIVQELQAEFSNARITGEESLADAILKIYATTGEQFAIIIDEYDVLIRERVADSVFNSYLAFLNAMFKNKNTSRPSSSSRRPYSRASTTPSGLPTKSNSNCTSALAGTFRRTPEMVSGVRELFG